MDMDMNVYNLEPWCVRLTEVTYISMPKCFQSKNLL